MTAFPKTKSAVEPLTYDPSEITALLAANLVYEFLLVLAQGR